MDSNFEVVSHLLNANKFCLKNKCYNLPIFSKDDEGNIQVMVQVSSQYLAPAMYVSCTILQNHRMLRYSHTVALLDNDTLHYPSDTLPSVTIQDLMNPMIDKMS